MDQKLEELRTLWIKCIGAPPLETFSESDLCDLLRRNSPKATLQSLVRAREGWERLCELERIAPRSDLERLLASGTHFVDGFDIDGRPVLWIKSLENNRNHRASTASVVAYYIWVYWWARKQRHDGAIRIIWDDTHRKPLDYDASEISEILNILGRLSLGQPRNEMTSVVVRSGPSELLLNFCIRITGARGYSVFSDKRDILSQLSDQSQYPSWFLPEGKPFRPCTSTLGKFQDLLDKNAYSGASLKDWYRIPDLEPVSEDNLSATLDLRKPDPWSDAFPAANVSPEYAMFEDRFQGTRHNETGEEPHRRASAVSPKLVGLETIVEKTLTGDL